MLGGMDEAPRPADGDEDCIILNYNQLSVELRTINLLRQKARSPLNIVLLCSEKLSPFLICPAYASEVRRLSRAGVGVRQEFGLGLSRRFGVVTLFWMNGSLYYSQ